MALQLPTGEYLVIEEVNRSSVTFRMHQDSAQRTRYKSGTMGKYECTSHQNRSVEVPVSEKADPERTVQENLITSGYEALKALEEFSEAIDA